MNSQLTKVCVRAIILLIVFYLIGSFSYAFATQSVAQEKAIGFIEKVLPVDLTKYNLTLTRYQKIMGPSDLAGFTSEVVEFTLDSKESTLVVTCIVQNNILISCNVIAKKGPVISDRQYANLVESVKTFLERYQTWTKVDSSDMINMLAGLDITKDSSIAADNIKFTLSTVNNFGTEILQFKWAYTINGVEYTSLQVGFQKNGIFDSLYDNRLLYSIGDTTVNISHEQAIDIAIKYSETYSYTMPDGSQIRGFNITKDQSKAQLVAYPINSTVLRPYWHVELYLNQTYPGSVKGLTIYVWANSGEVFHCSNIAYGGIDYSDADNLEWESPISSPSSSAQDNTSIISMGVLTITVIMLLVVGAKIARSYMKRK